MRQLLALLIAMSGWLPWLDTPAAGAWGPCVPMQTEAVIVVSVPGTCDGQRCLPARTEQRRVLGFGNGVAIGQTGSTAWILTNAHVVSEPHPQVWTSAGWVRGEVRFAQPELDLAVVGVPAAEGVRTVRLCRKRIHVPQQVEHWYCEQDGHVSRRECRLTPDLRTGGRYADGLLNLQCPVAEGQSGSGVYVSEGLAGIVSFRDPAAGNDGGVIPAIVILNWLNGLQTATSDNAVTAVSVDTELPNASQAAVGLTTEEVQAWRRELAVLQQEVSRQQSLLAELAPLRERRVVLEDAAGRVTDAQTYAPNEPIRLRGSYRAPRPSVP